MDVCSVGREEGERMCDGRLALRDRVSSLGTSARVL